MEKIFSTAFLIFSIFISAQNISVSAKANLLFATNSGSWSDISSTATTNIANSGKSNVGYNFGLSTKFDLGGLFLMPELYYTTFTNKYTVDNTTLEAQSNRVDLPVLLGKDFLLKKIGIFVGPVASYNLAKDNQWNDFKTNAPKQFTIGYQYGAMINFKNLIVSGKYEGAFKQDQRDFINNLTNKTIRYDNRPNLVIVGLGYKF